MPCCFWTSFVLFCVQLFSALQIRQQPQRLNITCSCSDGERLGLQKLCQDSSLHFQCFSMKICLLPQFAIVVYKQPMLQFVHFPYSFFADFLLSSFTTESGIFSFYVLARVTTASFFRGEAIVTQVAILEF